MAYNANIPQAGDQQSQSQGQILQNFQALQTLIDVNHVDFASGDQGKHKWVTMPEQATGPATAAAELALYAKHSTYGLTTTELFIRDPSNGTEFDISSSFAGAYGWSFLSSGLLMMWGFGTGTGDTMNVNITQLPAVTGPKLSAFYYFSAQTYNISVPPGTPSDTYVQVTNFGIGPGPTNIPFFRLFCSQRTTNAAATANYRWLAIGPVA